MVPRPGLVYMCIYARMTIFPKLPHSGNAFAAQPLTQVRRGHVNLDTSVCPCVCAVREKHKLLVLSQVAQIMPSLRQAAITSTLDMFAPSVALI